MTKVGERVLIVGKHPWSGFPGCVIAVSVAGPSSIAYPPGTRIYEVKLDGGHTCAAEGREIVAEPNVGAQAA
jgi:hypothetical protein